MGETMRRKIVIFDDGSAGHVRSRKLKGGERMTDKNLLTEKIKASGLKRGFIAEKLGTSYERLKKLIDGETPFKAHEIQKLCYLLNITDLQEKERIFFAKNVEEISTERG